MKKLYMIKEVIEYTIIKAIKSIAYLSLPNKDIKR